MSEATVTNVIAWTQNSRREVFGVSMGQRRCKRCARKWYRQRMMQTASVHWDLKVAAAAAICAVSSYAATAQQQRPLQVSVSPAVIGPGDVLRIQIAGQAGDRVSGSVLGQQLTFAFDVASGEWRALAGVDLDAKPRVQHTMRIARNEKESATRTITIAPKEFPVRRLRVAPAFVDPSPKRSNKSGATTSCWPPRTRRSLHNVGESPSCFLSMASPQATSAAEATTTGRPAPPTQALTS